MDEDSDYILRDAVSDDVLSIAALFTLAYSQSSHECKDAGHIAETLRDGDHIWIVCEWRSSIVTVMCAKRSSWNRSYEICYGITAPDHRGKRLSRRLYLECIARAKRRNDCEVIVAYVRNLAMHEMTTTGFAWPGVAVGHDGALNVANGKREFHIITMARNRQIAQTRIVSSSGIPRQVRAVGSQIEGPLGFDSEVGIYPTNTLVGPPGNAATEVDGFQISYIHNPSSLSNSLHLTGINRPDSVSLRKALTEFVSELHAVQHLSLHIMADKVALINQLQKLGFSITAFMPGWFPCNGFRYDCVMLVRSTFSDPPTSHGIGFIVSRFQDSFERTETTEQPNANHAAVYE